MPDEDRGRSGGVDFADGAVGARLRAAREAAGLTVEQVSATTRIRPQVLRELEADHLGTPGTAVYMRGHIRAAARAVGIDPSPLVRAFDEQVGASAPSLTVEPPAPVPAPRRPSGGLAMPLSAPPERSTPRWLSAVLVGLVVLVVLLLVGSLSGDDPDDRDALTSPSPASSAPPPTTTTTPPSPQRPAGTELVLTARGTSWISVADDETTLFEGTVDEGWDRRFAGPAPVRVRLGNAAAVVSTCGGAPGPAGVEGAVLEFTCTPEGLARP